MKLFVLLLTLLVANISNAHACMIVKTKVWGIEDFDEKAVPTGLSVFRGEVVSVNPPRCALLLGQPCWVIFRVIEYMDVAPVFLTNEVLHLKASGARKRDGSLIEIPDVGTEAIFGFSDYLGEPELAFSPLRCSNSF